MLVFAPARPGGDIPCNHSMIHQRQRRSRCVRFPCFVNSMILFYRNCARFSLSNDSLRALGCSVQGMQAMRCSWLKSGRVQIKLSDTEGDEVVLADLRSGEFFGELVLLDGKPRSADAVIVEDATLAILSRSTFLSLIDRRPGIALPLLSAMTHRLRRTDELLRHRVARNANEEEAARATFADRAADLIASFGGSWKFMIAAICFLAAWVIGNSWLLLGKVFDPFPYIFLNLILNMVTALQAPIIMMSQNRQAEKDHIRADLDYRVNLNNELMLSEIKRRLDALEQHSTKS